MKKPHKLYKKLGGKRSRAGNAFHAACRPIKALRLAFGRDVAARDAAENFSGVGVCKHTCQLVMQTLRAWGKTYRDGPKISRIFMALQGARSRPVVDARRPELD